MDGYPIRYQWTDKKTWAFDDQGIIREPTVDDFYQSTPWVVLHEDDRLRTAIWRLRPLVIHGVVYYDREHQVRFRAEDAFNPDRNRWLDWHDFSELWRGALEASGINWTSALQHYAAPVVYIGQYDPDLVDELVEQPSRVATLDTGEDRPQKGVIVRPVKERFLYDLDTTRVWGSAISSAYRAA